MVISRVFLFIILSFFANSFLSGQNKIKWLSWDEAVAKSKQEKKKVLVDIYTTWCGWCKRMDKTTLREEFIVDYINENFYPVKFDAEFKDNITHKGVVYSFVKTGNRGHHELAEILTKGKLSFPTVVFLDEDFDILQPVLGFQDIERFEKVITYFAGDHFKITPWRRYIRTYSRETYALPAGN